MKPSMNHWERVEEFFQKLLGLPAAERAEALDRLNADDPALHADVRALLRADESAGGFLEAAIADAAQEVAEAPSRAGERVGAYRLTAELGRGGMGTVYRAERADDQYRATVAVKFLRGGRADPDLARRFRAERQILADLVHPNIARLLDGGTATDGTPYIVMELVAGQPLDMWCGNAGLGLRARVRLFRQVCAAVQHAHQALVIHRDLKPNNILVTHDGAPKLLDFGIAKLIEDDAEGQQATAVLAMTSTYASPEQLRGERVTTASDVYSLGVVLYQLLTDRLPYDLQGLSPGEVERRVCGMEPTRPSERAAWDRVRELRGDLDNILLKALRKEPERRYGSAAELAEDLRRFLDREPVSARPDVLSYRAGRFVRRHVVGVAATTVAVILLAALTTTSLVQAQRATAERDRAEERRLTAERVTDFLVRLFEIADPNESRGDTVTARQMLDQGAARIMSELTDEPAVRASLAGAMGTVYRNLAALPQARSLIDSALAIRREVNGPTSAEYADALHEKAELFYSEGEYEAAELAHREALALRRALLPPGHIDVGSSLDGLGAALDALSRFEESEVLYREALEITRSSQGSEVPLTASSMTNLAGVLRHQAKYDEAIVLLRDALAIRRAALGDRHLDVAHGLNHLSRTLSLAGRHEEALPFAREGLAVRYRIHDGPHPETAASLGNLAGILAQLGRLDEAETERRASLAMLRQIYGDEHPYVATTLNSLARTLHLKGDHEAAVTMYRESIQLHRALLSVDNPNLAIPLTGLGRVLFDDGRPDEALPFLREAYVVRVEGLPDGHWQIADAATPLAAALTALNRFEEAEPLLVAAAQSLERTFGRDDERAVEARERLAQLLDASGR